VRLRSFSMRTQFTDGANQARDTAHPPSDWQHGSLVRIRIFFDQARATCGLAPCGIVDSETLRKSLMVNQMAIIVRMTNGSVMPMN
jgi:hypothetical protein